MAIFQILHCYAASNDRNILVKTQGVQKNYTHCLDCEVSRKSRVDVILSDSIHFPREPLMGSVYKGAGNVDNSTTRLICFAISHVFNIFVLS